MSKNHTKIITTEDKEIFDGYLSKFPEAFHGEITAIAVNESSWGGFMSATAHPLPLPMDAIFRPAAWFHEQSRYRKQKRYEPA